MVVSSLIHLDCVITATHVVDRDEAKLSSLDIVCNLLVRHKLIILELNIFSAIGIPNSSISYYPSRFISLPCWLRPSIISRVKSLIIAIRNNLLHDRYLTK